MKKQLLLTWIMLILPSSVWLQAGAAENPRLPTAIYQIEILIFSHFTAQSIRSEQWSQVPEHTTFPRKTIELSENNGYDQYFTQLNEAQWALSPEAQQLAKQKNYPILLHAAWIQPIVQARDARPVRISSHPLYNEGTAAGKEDEEIIASNPRNTLWQVDGTLTPSLNHYINIDLNLFFTAPFPDSQGEPYLKASLGHFIYFHLQENRRIKSQVLNYIDHPLCGVLIKVVPLTAISGAN